MKIHPLRALLVGALALLTLSACAGLHPGVAATVGDQTIPTSQVDDVTRISCDLGGNAQPRSAVMRDIVNALVTTRVDTQYAESVGASYDKAQLQQRVQQLEDSLTKLSDTDRDTYVQVVSDFLRSQLMLADVGAKSLKKKGTAKVICFMGRTAQLLQRSRHCISPAMQLVRGGA